MKKIMKVTQGKRFLSLILAVVMMATVFNMALPMLKLDASAAGEITTDTGEKITQTRVVGAENSSYAATYESYATQYLNGASKPTNIVIPGLDPAQDYVIQGMTYYPERDWMLVTAYHNDGTAPSKVFALDAETGDFVAMFSFTNVDGTPNLDHGGGIAVSEHNIYYACGDQDRKIAYAPITALRDAKVGSHTVIPLVAEKDFVEVGSIKENDKTAYTAYVCYDDGVLWTGNFYDPGASLIGLSIAATDYNAASNSKYKSMVFGYKLSGSSSAEEWANLTGAKGVDCQGSPSYAIGLSNAIKDIQYAVVDNGKLYLSRSFGTGAGNSVSFGFGETSTLTVADIDLSQPGTESVKISTKSTGSLDKDIMVHDIKDFQDYAMMPMSEGLCFIDDQLFITFEGASNKYMNESSGSGLGALTAIGNCTKPVDVIWQLDPYDLVELEKPAQEKSMYYERVNSLDDIKDGEEYIILFESVEKDPVSQNNILYAFNANGNFNGHRLSKGNLSEPVGYDGMIGHKITGYSIETDDNGVEKLYLSDPEKDDIESVRWIINKVSGTNYRIKSTDTYFANYKNFYVSEDKITMAPDAFGDLSKLYIEQLSGPGYFYVSKDKANYLWCNDGTNSEWMNKVNAFYKAKEGSAPIYNDLTETPGTFHCNATNAPVLGNVSVPEKKDDYPGIYYPDGAFQIYRRKVDSTSSTYESRVYSNLDTKLESDGTYTVTLDTYAISPNHYQYVGERPTDYIIVADTSNSMEVAGSTGMKRFDGKLSVSSLTLTSHTDDNQPDGVIGYTFYNPEENIHFKHEDGKYYKAYLAIRNTWKSSPKQYYYLYYIADDGFYYCNINQNKEIKKFNESQFKAWVAGEYGNDILQTASSNNGNNTTGGGRQAEELINGEHYRYDNINSKYKDDHNSTDALKTTAQNLVDQIKAQNKENRIAFVKYGSNSSYLNTSDAWTENGFTNAFRGVDDNSVNTLKTKISEITTTEQSSTSGIELQAAKAIIDNSDVTYNVDGRRNLAVIFLSDGVPGTEKTTTKTEDCETVIDTVTTSDATTAANNVINTAKYIKDKGGFIYTVLYGDNKADSFQKKIYMDAVSSKYPAATSLTNLGGQSVDGVTYAMSIATCSTAVFFNFGSIACKEVAVNNAVGLDNLDVNSYLRAVLDDAIVIPEDYSIKAQLVPGKYDAIGRFSFEAAKDTNDITPSIDRTKKTITVKGYDYSKQYISKENSGNALRIVIKGLLANEAKNLENAPVNVGGKTGIYKTETKMNADEAFRNLSTERINIPEYTYVLDYGLQLLDTDVNGTLCAVSDDLSKQNPDNYTKSALVGDLAIQEGDQNLLYSITPDAFTAEDVNEGTAERSGYTLIKRDDGTYDWFKIKVVPASNVYYEETTFDITDSSNPNWTEETNGTSATNRDLPEEGDVDGFDNAYDNNNKYSNGTILATTVDKSNKRSDTASVTFTGNGFDLVSACGPNTGVQLVAIKDATGKTIKSYIVDTYYKGELASADGSVVSQVPIVNWRTNTFGEYTVETKGYYLSNAGALRTSGIKNNLIDTGLVMNSANLEASADVSQILAEEGIDAENVEVIWFDDNSILNGGTGAKPVTKTARDGSTVTSLKTYVDGFRIYNPLGTDSSDYAESEKNASYVNVIENLAPVNEVLNGIGFISGTLAEGENLSFSNYESVGPQGEFYLKANQAITFKVKANPGDKVMLGLRAVNGATTINVSSNNSTQTVNNIAINSATEMFYDISNCIGAVTDDNTEVQVTIQNGSGILALNQVKFSGGEKVNANNPATRSLARSGEATQVYSNLFLPLTQEDLIEVENTFTTKEAVDGIVKNGVVIPLVEEEEEIPGGNTTPDIPEVPGDDTNNDDTNTDSGEKEEFSIFSLLELLISLIEKLLHSAFGTGSLF